MAVQQPGKCCKRDGRDDIDFYPSYFHSILSLCSSYILTLIPKDFSSAYSPA